MPGSAAILAEILALGVPDGIAQSNAEGIEHHVSPDTLALFKRYPAPRR